MKLRVVLSLAVAALVVGGPLALPAAAALPAAPTAVTAQAGNASAVVSWHAPSDDGGQTITGYVVTSSPGNVTANAGGSARSATVTGLTNGTSYTFTVKAVNASGTGPASSPASPVTPIGPPSAPRSVTASAGAASATVSWLAPASNGGDAITSYRVTSTPGNKVTTTNGSATGATVTGLTNGTSYTFTVAAVNGAGTGTASDPTAPVTPRSLPSAPQNVTATAGDRSIVVKWSAPASTGGSSITAYKVTTEPGGRSVTTSGSARTATVSSLTNGTAYTVTVQAVTASGTGPSGSPASTVTPFGLPFAPTSVSAIAGDRSATVSWAGSGNNGSPITSFKVTSSPGGKTATTSGTTNAAVVTGLTNGTSYTFTVTATNAAGTSAKSPVSNAVRPAAINVVERLAGTSRIATAIAVSQHNWATASTGATPLRSLAQAVVLTRADSFADALAGTPLAAKKVGPLLLTPSDALDSTVRDEIRRVLSPGRTVYVLGGTIAVSSGTEALLRSDGYIVVRLAGADRFATAVEVAVTLGDPNKQLLVNGLDFPDALAAGVAAAHIDGVVLLTDGPSMAAATGDYLRVHGGTRYTVGGKAAIAYPAGVPVVGADRYETAVLVARKFFGAAASVGVASGRGFADALSGGAHVSARGGPLLLVGDTLPAVVRTYLVDHRDDISHAYLYGGSRVVSDQVLNDVRIAMT